MSAALVKRILKAHGGEAAWRNAERLFATCSMGGMDFLTRMQPAPLREVQVSVAAGAPQGQIAPFGGTGDCGCFDVERVWIEDHNGELVAERAAAGGTGFSGRSRLWWDRLEVLHQAAAILWFALNMPGLLVRPDVKCQALDPVRDGRQNMDRLKVVLPNDLGFHGTEHVLYADSTGLIRRVDSRSLIYGGMLSVSQLWEGHETFDGLLIATRRSYYPTLLTGSPWQFARLVWLDLDDVSVSRRPK
jgi:hypothetical protein